jgi:hypothetical protein
MTVRGFDPFRPPIFNGPDGQRSGSSGFRRDATTTTADFAAYLSWVAKGRPLPPLPGVTVDTFERRPTAPTPPSAHEEPLSLGLIWALRGDMFDMNGPPGWTARLLKDVGPLDAQGRPERGLSLWWFLSVLGRDDNQSAARRTRMAKLLDAAHTNPTARRAVIDAAWSWLREVRADLDDGSFQTIGYYARDHQATIPAFFQDRAAAARLINAAMRTLQSYQDNPTFIGDAFFVARQLGGAELTATRSSADPSDPPYFTSDDHTVSIAAPLARRLELFGPHVPQMPAADPDAIASAATTIAAINKEQANAPNGLSERIRLAQLAAPQIAALLATNPAQRHALSAHFAGVAGTYGTADRFGGDVLILSGRAVGAPDIRLHFTVQGQLMGLTTATEPERFVALAPIPSEALVDRIKALPLEQRVFELAAVAGLNPSDAAVRDFVSGARFVEVTLPNDAGAANRAFRLVNRGLAADVTVLLSVTATTADLCDLVFSTAAGTKTLADVPAFSAPSFTVDRKRMPLPPAVFELKNVVEEVDRVEGGTRVLGGTQFDRDHNRTPRAFQLSVLGMLDAHIGSSFVIAVDGRPFFLKPDQNGGYRGFGTVANDDKVEVNAELYLHFPDAGEQGFALPWVKLAWELPPDPLRSRYVTTASVYAPLTVAPTDGASAKEIYLATAKIGADTFMTRSLPFTRSPSAADAYERLVPPRLDLVRARNRAALAHYEVQRAEAASQPQAVKIVSVTADSVTLQLLPALHTPAAALILEKQNDGSYTRKADALGTKAVRLYRDRANVWALEIAWQPRDEGGAVRELMRRSLLDLSDTVLAAEPTPQAAFESLLIASSPSEWPVMLERLIAADDEPRALELVRWMLRHDVKPIPEWHDLLAGASVNAQRSGLSRLAEALAPLVNSVPLAQWSPAAFEAARAQWFKGYENAAANGNAEAFLAQLDLGERLYTCALTKGDRKELALLASALAATWPQVAKRFDAATQRRMVRSCMARAGDSAASIFLEPTTLELFVSAADGYEGQDGVTLAREMATRSYRTLTAYGQIITKLSALGP